jgi:hydrogenase expression/formation protein HypD
MKHITEYRDIHMVQGVIGEIKRTVTRPWVIMEICGGQTHAIMRYGIDQLLPEKIQLVHGPGCPVCVTPLEMIDKALAIASRREVIFTSFGDMLRVPGSKRDLFSVRAAGGDVRVVYSPLDSIKIAQENPNKQVVFFAIGFETTAPANAMSVLRARSFGLRNFSVLVSHVRVPPAMCAILDSPDNRVQGFLAAGHVCSVMGFWEYPAISEKYHVPIVVTGFEPLDIVQGILMTLRQLETQRNFKMPTYQVENAYPRAVTFEGNHAAQAVINQVFQISDRKWRGIGTIPDSGLILRPEFTEFDAEKKFAVDEIRSEESADCIAGQILRGIMKPVECPAFGQRCTPEHPLGATMVSAEGACAAYYHYHGILSENKI